MSVDPTKKLNGLLKKLRAQHTEPAAPVVTPEAPDEFDPLVHQLVFSMLLWEASTAQARNALKRVREAVVDYNELRVCVADEVAHIIGDKYPLALERAMRLRSTLNDIYQRQHSISLKHLSEGGKREARQYLDALGGCPPYVAARVCVVSGLGHGVPLDERLLALLVEEQVFTDKTSVEQAASWLSHHIKAEESLEAHLLLQAWSDEHGHPPKRDKRPITIQVQSAQADAKHDGKSEARDTKDAKGVKPAAKARPKAEAAAKKSKTRPRSGS